MALTRQQFAEKIKTKYPMYADMDNDELASKMIAKYPVYKSQISDVYGDLPKWQQYAEKGADISEKVLQKGSELARKGMASATGGASEQALKAGSLVAGITGIPEELKKYAKTAQGKTIEERALPAIATTARIAPTVIAATAGPELLGASKVVEAMRAGKAISGLSGLPLKAATTAVSALPFGGIMGGSEAIAKTAEGASPKEIAKSSVEQFGLGTAAGLITPAIGATVGVVKKALGGLAAPAIQGDIYAAKAAEKKISEADLTGMHDRIKQYYAKKINNINNQYKENLTSQRGTLGENIAKLGADIEVKTMALSKQFANASKAVEDKLQTEGYQKLVNGNTTIAKGADEVIANIANTIRPDLKNVPAGNKMAELLKGLTQEPEAGYIQQIGKLKNEGMTVENTHWAKQYLNSLSKKMMRNPETQSTGLLLGDAAKQLSYSLDETLGNDVYTTLSNQWRKSVDTERAMSKYFGKEADTGMRSKLQAGLKKLKAGGELTAQDIESPAGALVKQMSFLKDIGMGKEADDMGKTVMQITQKSIDQASSKKQLGTIMKLFRQTPEGEVFTGKSMAGTKIKENLAKLEDTLTTVKNNMARELADTPKGTHADKASEMMPMIALGTTAYSIANFLPKAAGDIVRTMPAVYGIYKYGSTAANVVLKVVKGLENETAKIALDDKSRRAVYALTNYLRNSINQGGESNAE